MLLVTIQSRAAAQQDSTHTLVSRGADLMAAGTDPVSWLLDRSRFVRPVSPTQSPGSDGIKPVNPLPLRLLQEHDSHAGTEIVSTDARFR
jgi:hypothetical protein